MKNHELEREIVELPDRSCDLSQKIAIERTSEILLELYNRIKQLESKLYDVEGTQLYLFAQRDRKY